LANDSAMTAGVGIVIGLAMAFTLTRFLKTFLYEITATDLPTFIVSIAVLGSVALVANYLPARKASGLNPAEALRFD